MNNRNSLRFNGLVDVYKISKLESSEESVNGLFTFCNLCRHNERQTVL